MVTEFSRFTKISSINYRGKIALRFTFGYRHTIPTKYIYSEENLIRIKVLIEKIQQDILNNNFDFTHNRYVNKKISKKLSELYLEWVGERMSDPNFYNLRTIFNDEFDLYKINTVLVEKIAVWNTQTFNRRKRIINDFYEYLLSIAYIKFNPINIPNKKKSRSKSVKLERMPLSSNEIKKILSAFENDTFCPKYSRVKHSYYYPFITRCAFREENSLIMRLLRHFSSQRRLILKILAISCVIANVVKQSFPKFNEKNL